MRYKPPFARFSIAFLLLVGLITGGTIGYSLIEQWSLEDSLYMTFITITTVGFGEVHPLSVQGKHFTIVFLIFSIVTVGYSITTLITFIFEGQILDAVRERRMKRSIKRLKDHYIICGGGEVGREVALEFQRESVKFVIVDREPSKSELSKDESVLFVEGEAEDDEVLKEASIETARGLISVLPDDESNVFVVLTARQLNPKLTIVSKAVEERTIRKLLKAGANRVISPYQIAGKRLASIILRPSVVDFLEVMVDGGKMPMRIEEVAVNTGSPLIGKNLREAGVGQHTGAIIVGIMNPSGRAKINPTSTSTLAAIKLNDGDTLIAMGSEEQIKRLQDFVRRG